MDALNVIRETLPCIEKGGELEVLVLGMAYNLSTQPTMFITSEYGGTDDGK